eukprot:365725-Chlamydomonas_euryale.AAC.17
MTWANRSTYRHSIFCRFWKRWPRHLCRSLGRTKQDQRMAGLKGAAALTRRWAAADLFGRVVWASVLLWKGSAASQPCNVEDTKGGVRAAECVGGWLLADALDGRTSSTSSTRCFSSVGSCSTPTGGGAPTCWNAVLSSASATPSFSSTHSCASSANHASAAGPAAPPASAGAPLVYLRVSRCSVCTAPAPASGPVLRGTHRDACSTSKGPADTHTSCTGGAALSLPPTSTRASCAGQRYSHRHEPGARPAGTASVDGDGAKPHSSIAACAAERSSAWRCDVPPRGAPAPVPALPLLRGQASAPASASTRRSDSGSLLAASGSSSGTPPTSMSASSGPIAASASTAMGTGSPAASTDSPATAPLLPGPAPLLVRALPGAAAVALPPADSGTGPSAAERPGCIHSGHLPWSCVHVAASAGCASGRVRLCAAVQPPTGGNTLPGAVPLVPALVCAPAAGAPAAGAVAAAVAAAAVETAAACVP